MSSKASKNSAKQQQQPQRLKIWNQCSNCGLIIQKFANEEHTCVSEFGRLADLFRAESKFAEQSFVFENEFIGNACEHDKELLKDLSLSKEILFDFAFVNTQTLMLCGFRMGDLLSIKCVDLESDDQVITSFPATAWPTNNLDHSSISLNKLYMSLNGIQKRERMILVANRIDESMIQNIESIDIKLIDSISSNKIVVDELTSGSSGEDAKLIVSLLKQVYANKCIFDAQPLSLVYMGQKLIFSTQRIQVEKTRAPKKKNESIIENLIDSFDAKLSLNSSKSFIESNIKPIKRSSRANDRAAFKFTHSTRINLIVEENKEKSKKTGGDDVGFDSAIYSFSQIGGLEKELELLKELFITPFKYESLYKEIGVDLSKGVLLYGPGGCGKTLLAKAVCVESKCAYVELSITQVYSKNLGEAESKMRKVFQQAWQRAPCIMIIDELDTLCARRESLQQDTDKRIVSLFSGLMDQSKAKNILFLCTTNKPDLIDLSLRRPGRLDKEIEIPIPNQSARLAILKNLLRPMKHSLSDESLAEVAQNCHGYVGADLAMLVQEAGLVCLNRVIAQNNSSSLDQCVTASDLQTGMRKVKPSAMREITFDIPKVYWNQIGGLSDLKKKLHQAITWPIKYADSFRRLNIKAPRGLLMYGPPGCSKTMIAKALATETGLNFIAVKGPELFSKWVGESERTVREIFRKARNAAPAIIFFDEIDAIAMERSRYFYLFYFLLKYFCKMKRMNFIFVPKKSSSNKSNNVGDRVLAQLLNEMDGVESLNDVTIVAATNRPDMIDKALMRPGRLDRIVYVRLPDEATRREIFELKLKQIPLDDDIDLNLLVSSTAKYSGAEIAAVCNEAAFLALDSDINTAKIGMKNFVDALKLVTPRTSDETIKYFNNFSFGSGLHEI